jgi:hypothetical protein
VQEARRQLRFPVMLCGSMFGLRVQRHRYFECPWLPLTFLPECRHHPDDLCFDHGTTGDRESDYRDAMGCYWMTCKQARQAIPPAYTEWLGRLLLAHLTA